MSFIITCGTDFIGGFSSREGAEAYMYERLPAISAALSDIQEGELCASCGRAMGRFACDDCDAVEVG